MAKTKPPYFSFYPKDFSADSVVESMSTLGVGAYILLLCKAWHEEPAGSLPNDDCILSRWARLGSDDWVAVRSEVLAAFTLAKDGRYHQRRMREEFNEFLVKSKKASASANKRWNKDATALRPHCEGNARASGSGSNSGSEEKKGDARGTPPGCLRTDAFKSAWVEYETYRQESKLKKLVDRSVKSQWKKLETYGHDNALESIKITIANGWQGLFDPRDSKRSGIETNLSRVHAEPGKYDGLARQVGPGGES